MNKIPFLLVLFLAFSTFTKAQYFTPSVISLKQTFSLPYNNTYILYGKNVSIAVNPASAITYYEYLDVSNPTNYIQRGGFVYNYNAYSCYSFDLPDNIYVMDAKQVGNSDNVAFCGYIIEIISLPGGAVSSTKKGVIGWFNLSVNSVYMHYCIIPEIFRFEKIESFFNYVNNDKPTILAIGQLYSNFHRDIIFYMEDFLFTGPLQYKYYEIPNDEYLTDIVRSEKYISIVGSEWTNNGVCVRKEKLTNLSNPTLLYERNTFAYTEDASINSIHATYAGNRTFPKKDTIAISTTWINNSGDYFTRFRFIDVDQMVMTAAQEYSLEGKNDVSELTYVSDDRLLCPLMMYHPISYDPYSTVVFIDPSQNSMYSANLIYDMEHYYTNIDCIDYQHSNCNHILLGGLNTWFLKKASNPTSYNCNEKDSIDVKIIQPIQKIAISTQLNVVSNSVNPIIVTKSWTSFVPNSECIETNQQ